MTDSWIDGWTDGGTAHRADGGTDGGTGRRAEGRVDGATEGRADGGATGPTGASTDRIILTGISATGYHGVFDHERRDGQQFSADLELHVDTRPAAGADRLDLTVDYGTLAEDVAAVLSGAPADLIETVAERIAAVAMQDDRVRGVDVVVHKPTAPVTVPVADVAVRIHRDRTRMPVVDPPGALPGQPPAPEPEPRAAPLSAIPPLMMPPAAMPPMMPPAAMPPLMPPAHEAQPAHRADDARDRLDLAPDGSADVVLALGSNVGDSRETLRRTVEDLAGVGGIEITAVGPLARTAPVGSPDQPDFLNTVVLGRTRLSPRALLHACQEVERRHGRVREERWGPRTLDIDLIAYGSVVAVADDLELPHPRAHERAFVLQPWSHLDPAAVLPGLGGGPVAALAQTAPDAAGIRWMALDWWGAGATP